MPRDRPKYRIVSFSGKDDGDLVPLASYFPRPARQPVSLRLDPFDISMLKRIARNKGISHTQLMAIWLHERIEKENAGEVIRSREIHGPRN